jgi:hypothetical protein
MLFGDKRAIAEFGGPSSSGGGSEVQLADLLKLAVLLLGALAALGFCYQSMGLLNTGAKPVRARARGRRSERVLPHCMRCSFTQTDPVPLPPATPPAPAAPRQAPAPAAAGAAVASPPVRASASSAPRAPAAPATPPKPAARANGASKPVNAAPVSASASVPAAPLGSEDDVDPA